MNGRKARAIRRLHGVPHVRNARLTRAQVRAVPRIAANRKEPN
jgi:hypothetical protein